MASEINFFKTELPPEDLLNDPNWEVFKNFGEQWSQLVAWSWLEGFYLSEQEQKLKSKFIDFLQRQALNTEISVKCDVDDPVIAKAVNLAKDIKYMLLGEKEISGIRITLSDVLEQLTGKGLMTTVNDEVKTMFKELFIVRVTPDSFVGQITKVQLKPAQNVLDEDKKLKYVLYLAYPPRPALSAATLTEQVLYNWANNIREDDSVYGPPSPYIPWSAC